MTNGSSSLDAVMRKINKQADSIVFAKGVPIKDYSFISIGSPSADFITYGGLPEGRMIEICGPESGGKTTTALMIVAQYQKKKTGKQVVYLDNEQTFDSVWATKLGVDVENIYLIQPEEMTAEQIYDLLIEVIETGDVGLIVIDSVATLVPGIIFEESMTKYNIGGIAKSLSLFCNKFIPKMKKYNTTTIAINQVRDNMDSMYVQYETPGGKAFKHACTIRLMVTAGDAFTFKGEPTSRGSGSAAYHKVKIKLLKNKVTPPNRPNGSYTLNYVKGVDVVMDTIATAAQFNLVLQNGPYYTLVDLDTGEILKDDSGKDLKFQGKTAMTDYFNQHPEKFDELLARTQAALKKLPE